MIRVLLISAALAACGGAAAADGRSQLAASLGLSTAEAATLSSMQLAMLKHVVDNPNFSEDEKRRRSKAILSGASPRLQLRF